MAVDPNGEKKLDLDKLNDEEKFLYRDYKEDLQAHDDAIVDFDAYEAMHMGKTYDSVSKETTNGLTDSMTATIYLERAARVAGQLPEGEMQAFGKKDLGKGMFMDILRQKWIYPNANAQRSFKTKMFMWQYGSSEYGYMPMYYDLNVSPSGYFGPDCWLWNPRNFVPQAGMTSVADMDYVHAIAYKSPRFFEDLLDEESDNKAENKKSGWNFDAIRDVRDLLKEAKSQPQPSRETKQQREQNNQTKRLIPVVTRYEAGKGGRWITFLPDQGYKIIRNIKNPHKNGRIPFVIKPCIPTFDSFYNIGDFQRSMPMQFANDGLDNFYFQGIKINLFPPTAVNMQTAVPHTITQDPASIWEFNGTPDVRRLETSTAGLATYQNAKGMSKGAIQSIAGTTDTRANQENSSDPGFGKTPEALKMMQMRESTRDNQDRELLEEAMKELIDGMVSLIPTIKEKIPVDLFSTEIAEIVKAGHTDLVDILKMGKRTGLANFRVSESKTQMRLRIDPSKFEGLEYRFELQPNSTAKKTKEAQLTALMDYLGFIGKMPNLLETFSERTGKVLNLEAINNQFGLLADIPGMDEMFIDGNKPTTDDTQMDDGSGASGQVLTPEQAAAASGAQPAPALPQAPQAAQVPVAQAPVAPVPVAQPQPLPVAAPVNPLTGAPHDPAIAAEIARLEAMRGAPNA